MPGRAQTISNIFLLIENYSGLNKKFQNDIVSVRKRFLTKTKNVLPTLKNHIFGRSNFNLSPMGKQFFFFKLNHAPDGKCLSKILFNIYECLYNH